MATLPPLAALRAFEATVGLGGLARAAIELNITTSAVSHRLRRLEEDLGTRLLQRSTGAGGIRVTPAGARLLSATGGALSLLEDACAEIRGTTRRLTVSANVSLSTMWLAQRLAEFSALYPTTPINAIIQLAEPDYARYGWPANAMCNRRQTDQATLLVNPCRIAKDDAERYAPETKIVRYTSFSQVIGAAVAGAGLALGRSPLIDPELTSGRLVRLCPDLSRRASWRFVLRRGPGRRHMLGPLIDFLRAEVGSPSLAPSFDAEANPKRRSAGTLTGQCAALVHTARRRPSRSGMD